MPAADRTELPKVKAIDVAIAGAGPAGLAVALFLRRAGHRVTLFERFAAPEPVGSGLLLQPTGLTVLAALDLLSEMLALGNRIDRLEGQDAQTQRSVLDVRYDCLKGGRFGLAVHRSALFGVLMGAARKAGIATRTGCEIVGAEVGERVAVVDALGRRHGAFDLLIDASGGRSRLRSLALRPSEPKPLAYGAVWTTVDFPAQGFDPRALTQRYHEARIMIGVLPLGRPFGGEGEKAAFFWSLKPDAYPAVQAAGIERWKAEVLGHWPEARPILQGISGFEALSLARYGHHTLAVPAGRRIAFIGDSAHSTSPQLGQGANMALLDAAALAHALSNGLAAGGGGIEDALGAYADARRRHVAVFQFLSRWLTPFYQSDSRATAILRDGLVGGVGRLGPARKIMASMVSGTLVDPFAKAGLAEVRWPEFGAL